MAEINIVKSLDSGCIVYKFTYRGTEYSVLTEDEIIYLVYSKRLSLNSRYSIGTPPVSYGSANEMGKRNKALAYLALIIEQEKNKKYAESLKPGWGDMLKPEKKHTVH